MTNKDENTVVAEPGTIQYTKTGDARAVDTQRVKGPGDFYPRSADEENLAAGPKSPTDPNYLEALRKTEGGQEEIDARAEGTDGDSTYGPTGDVTKPKDDDAKGTSAKDAKKDDGAKADDDAKGTSTKKDDDSAKDSKADMHTDRNVDVKVQPASSRTAK